MNSLPKCKHDKTAREWKNFIVPEGRTLAELRKLAPDTMKAPLPPITIPLGGLVLKRININEGASEDTLFFDAEIWWAGQYVGGASNRGQGAPSDIRPAWEGALDAAEAWGRQLPPESSYNRVYKHMFLGKETTEDIEEAWWATTTYVDLAWIIHVLVYDRSYENRFKDVPYYYYPAPHPFASRVAPLGAPIRHIPTGQVGVASYKGTNDRQVTIEIGKRADGKSIICPPHQVEFVVDAPHAPEIIEDRMPQRLNSTNNSK